MEYCSLALLFYIALMLIIYCYFKIIEKKKRFFLRSLSKTCKMPIEKWNKLPYKVLYLCYLFLIDICIGYTLYKNSMTTLRVLYFPQYTEFYLSIFLGSACYTYRSIFPLPIHRNLLENLTVTIT